jgi:hypothetical protein
LDELGVEDEVLRRLAVLALPEIDEAEDLVGRTESHGETAAETKFRKGKNRYL